MLGGGFAFALLPLLRQIFGSKGPALEAALARHSEHFNAHPYLVGVALGAVARLEQEGESAEMVRRFKAAVKGPLGGIGDSLVWATWLPLTLLLVLTMAWAGLGPFLSVLLFLLLYNGGHLAIRVWAFRVGLREGKRVGARLREAALGHRTDLLVRLGALLLGALAGVLLLSGRALGGTGVLWPALAVAGFVLGLNGGFRVWRPTALAVVGIILSIILTQAVT
jgi:mannose/fructose/N-acetylgalactosamine-specific phosphotransferase system component IID